MTLGSVTERVETAVVLDPAGPRPVRRVILAGEQTLAQHVRPRVRVEGGRFDSRRSEQDQFTHGMFYTHLRRLSFRPN